MLLLLLLLLLFKCNFQLHVMIVILVVVVVPISSDYLSPNNAVDPPNDPATQWASSSFSDKRIRHKFIQKVHVDSFCHRLNNNNLRFY